MIRWYVVVDANAAAARMDEPACATTAPRFRLDGSQAILRYRSEVAGAIGHTEAAALMGTAPWVSPEPAAP